MEWQNYGMAELWNGARGKNERSVLAEFQRTLTCLEVNAHVWSASRKLALLARRSGITCPSVDLVIAACAFFYNVQIEHCDRHLELLGGLRSKL